MVELLRNACLIDGQWVKGDESRDVFNPADDSRVGNVPRLGAAETERAIAAAERAFPLWAARSAAERSTILLRYHALILAHEEALAAILTAEQGKPLAEALGEIRYAASFIQWFGEEAKRAYGDVIPGPRADRRIWVLKQPIGVVAAITPWNFPAAMVTRKIGPALAAGCTVILKPAEQTPLTALALGALAQEAGLPNGVLNIVTGQARAIGAALTASPVVRKLSFTGSTEVGALLYAQSAPTIKKLSLELGGNAPFIVFDDADLDQAVQGAIDSKFRNAGQTCVCANRFYVQTGIYDRFVEGFAKAAAALKVGRGDDPASQIGPLIDDKAVAKVRSHIEDAIGKGARLVGIDRSADEHGRFVAPRVLADVQDGMLALAEETFGPLAPVVRFDDEAEAVALANATPFGLAAYVYTNDARRVMRVSEAIEAGMVGVNTGLISTEVAPFGGIKASGLGREGSRHGMDDYMELKTVTLAL
ncbi:NAD-dependent succinate-semialdehyde dehydrogenase [Sphingobium sp. CAP-1]|uniref:NAD-dependent succinate-semialdehyde dehydrogenase n=1 Tax=Sphingobium sp. CAP-1 TaxID=2676077 RepID=UPI0012BB40B9|nr:NAD-dependent succinate-semialdehyde dehydrogenase [Sphingobium sp. CAP-1]QGP80419.1 succinate-semialdehyde dehydrogenase [Sphingobium sp. CAP-1]